jgi:tripartite motif-containing protein 71
MGHMVIPGFSVIRISATLVLLSVIFCLLLIPLPAGAAQKGNVAFSATVITAPLSANFSSNVTGGAAPLAVRFSDTSGGSPSSWLWKFGDGGTSREQNPVYVYRIPGTYTLTLTVTNSGRSNTISKAGMMTVTAPVKKPIADFSANPRTGNAPLSVQFTDISRNNPTTWTWNFGDGVISDVRNPMHKYDKSGRYIVQLQVSNSGGTDTAIRRDYIIAYSGPLNADFIGIPVSGRSPLTVQFTDFSTGEPGFWLWWFGDGLLDLSFRQNPVYTYSNPGKYPVRLVIFRGSEMDTVTRTGYITVTR